MNDEDIELVYGSDNPFRDVGLGNPDLQLIKAKLATSIVRELRQRKLTNVAAAKIANVQTADISRIRNADLDRFTIDRLVRILNGLGQRVEVHVTAHKLQAA